jgi:hypothetical protein
MPASCSAARAGIASFHLGLLPFVNFEITFIGTGTAMLQDDIEFDRLQAGDIVHMKWVNNKFIGRHWLLGNIIIELNHEFQSMGRVEKIERWSERNQGFNTNEFYFTFKFPRFRNLAISNKQPIVNSSVVYDIPPTEESIYSLERKSRSVKVALAGREETSLNFNFCDITLFPERNISIEILDVVKSPDNSYTILVQYTNLTSVNATCAYFLVLHDQGLITPNDYGFRRVNPDESFVINFKVSHKRRNVTVDLPIFGGLYLPKNLRGSSQKSVSLDF